MNGVSMVGNEFFVRLLGMNGLKVSVCLLL